MKFARRSVTLLVVIVFVLSPVVFNHRLVFAEDPTSTSTPTLTPIPSSSDESKAKEEELKKKETEIKDLQNKISDLIEKEKTLSSQISIMNSQIKLTEIRIYATKQEIFNLVLDIDITTKKIAHLQETLSSLTEILLNRIVATYEAGRIQPFEILLSSSNASSFFSRLNYLEIAQSHDKRLIYDTQAAKNDYANQKGIFENKKKKVESLKSQLEAYTNQLAQEKKDREALLKVTQNSEAIYQQRLQTALAEQRAIALIAAGGGNAVFVGKIKEGDIVGHMIFGKSACSSGTHLHFEVHKNNNLADPTGYLSNKSLTFENSPDGQFSFNGSWNWPLVDPVLIEQGFGMTYWARIGWYAGGPHTGIDMFSNSSLEVKAVKDGDFFRGSISCGGGQLLFARVDQADGIQTYYLHIVP